MQDVEQVILLLVSGQGMLISLALLTAIFKKNYGSFSLGLISLVITLEVLNTWGMRVSYHNIDHPFPFWIFGSYLLIPPALWLFLKANTIPKFAYTYRHWALFIPALIEIIVEFFVFYSNQYLGTEYRMQEHSFWFLFTEVLPIILMVFVLFLFLKELQKIRMDVKQLARGRSSNELNKLGWFFGVFSILTVFWILQGLLQFQVFQIIEVILLLFLFGLAYLSYFRPSFFDKPRLAITQKTKDRYPQYQNKQELDRLQKLFEVDKIYMQPKLSLKEVAAQLHLPQRYISELINSHYQTNFNSFTNSFRVAEVLQRINDPKEKNKTLLGIALECGFNSKSSFNQIFKKETGKNPSYFLEDT